MPTLEEKIAPQVRMMQIVVGGLAVSPIAFAGIALLIGKPIGADAAALLTKIALVLGLVMLFSQQIIGGVVCRKAAEGVMKRSGDDPEALAGAYMAGLLVSSGLCIAGAFINLIAFMVTLEPINLAMGALLVLATLVRFPTVERVANWARGEQRRCAEMSGFANDE